MLGSLKKSVKGIVKSKCHLCGDIVRKEPVRAEVKIPSYTGTHEKVFCCKQHLEEWKEEVREWEEKHHEIPDENKGSTCVNCMR